MRVYHGGLNSVKKPNAKKGRSSTDFGRGFYTTMNFEQAKSWALAKQKTAGDTAEATVTVYEIDENLLNENELQKLKFESPNKDWLSFVVSCRKERKHSYDIVFGAVANDKIYATITLYESDVLTAEETIARLNIKEFYNQIAFHTKKATDKLIFIEAIIVKD